jgi:phosphatidylinositol alpha-1,6-mannosyltransferase
MRARLGLDGRPVVGVVGRLRREKGQKWLLDVMCAVAGRLPRTSLVVVGDGPDRAALRACARQIGLRESVVWVGQVTHEEALACMGAVDVLAVPSEWEGFGLVAAEAMACGLAVVASDVDGLREVVEDGVTGTLVPYGDTAEMADAVARLLLVPEERARMGAEGRRRAERLFSREVFAERHLSLYRALG